MKFGAGSYYCDRPCAPDFFMSGNNYCCCRAPAVLHATWATNNPTCFALCYNLPTVIPLYLQVPFTDPFGSLVGPTITPAYDTACTAAWVSDGYYYTGVTLEDGHPSGGPGLQFVIQCAFQGDYENVFLLWIIGDGGACTSVEPADGRFFCDGAIGARYSDSVYVANSRSRAASCNPVHMAFPPVLLTGATSDGPRSCGLDMTFPSFPLGIQKYDLLTLEFTSVT